MSSDANSVIPPAMRNLLKIRDYREQHREKCISITLDVDPEVIDVRGNIHGSFIALATIVAAENAAKMSIHEDEFLVAVNHSVNFLKQPESLSEIEISSCVSNRTDRLIYVTTTMSSLDTDIANSITIFIAEKFS